MSELVSVIIPSYNREKTLERSVQSVLQQTYVDLEIIIVDDCSQDNTYEVAKSIKDSRVFVYRLPENSGACFARNFGVKQARGSLIAFQDSDDEWCADKLAKEIIYMKQNNYDFVTCAFNKIENGKTELFGMHNCKNKSRHQLWCDLLRTNWISTQTIVCYKKCFDLIEFDTAVRRYQDWDLGLKAVLLFDIGALNEPLVNVYLQENSISNTQTNNNLRLLIIEKHAADIDLNDKKMVSKYYEVLADANRHNQDKAARLYSISLKNRMSFKCLICFVLCKMHLMQLNYFRLFLKKLFLRK